MRLLIQRVKEAQILVNEKSVGEIKRGLLVFLGIHATDTPEKGSYLVKKLLSLRIFADESGKMNHSLAEIEGEIAVVSQFTLYGKLDNGRRPDFTEAALPETAFLLYEQFVSELTQLYPNKVATGLFGASMEVHLVNEGPVTFLLEK